MKYSLKMLILLIWGRLFEAAWAGAGAMETNPLLTHDVGFATATQLRPAVILTIADVAKASFKPSSPLTADSTLPHQQYDITANSTKVGTIDEQPAQVIISFKGIDSLFSTSLFNYLMCSRTPYNGHEGGIHSGVMSAFRSMSASAEYRSLFNLDINNRRKKDFIFTGYGFGGAIALLAALDFEHKINREAFGSSDTTPRLRKNQVKVVTFSAPKVVDADLKRIYSTRIGKENILQFQYYSDYSPTLPCIYEDVGIPIRMLTYEQMRDAYYDHARWSKLFYGSLTIAGGILLATLSKDTEKDALLAKRIGGSVVSGLTAVDTFLIGTPALPSPESLFMSFMDTKHNVEDYKASLSGGVTTAAIDIPDDVGSVSMFSFQRGFLKWLYGILSR